MSDIFENTITAALMFKVPQKVGWSVQNNDQSWTGSELSTLLDCLAQGERQKSTTLSLSFIFELNEDEAAAR